jgi:replicative DNA helicase
MAIIPNVSMRELVEQAVSQMTSCPSYSERPKAKPWDFAFMDFLTSNARPNQLMLVVGESYLDEVQKYAYYYATKLKKKCWYISESTPMPHVLSMLSLASGIPREDLLDLKVAPPDFGTLNDGAAELCEADCRFSLKPSSYLADIVSLAKTVKKQEGVEVLLIDALHRIEYERGRTSTPAEQGLISQVLRAVAHAGELTVIAGFHRPGDPFADLASDSTFFCDP